MIHVRQVSKIFRIPHVKQDTLYHRILSLATKTYTFEDFYALRNVTFHVPQGQFVGIVGRNGSGKSTLLKLLSRIYRPTSGEVAVSDEVYPLLELSVGFQRDFSVRENIILYGALIGFSRDEMKRKLDEIVDFADLERFVDARLDRLSTGMQTRLGVAIAIQSVAPIILVDEVLAVGDKVFSEKSRSVFRGFKREGRTIVLVTHDMTAVKEFCDRVLVLHQGSLAGDGRPEDMVPLYTKVALESQTRSEVGLVKTPPRIATIPGESSSPVSKGSATA